MSGPTLREQAAAYVALRRSLGFKLDSFAFELDAMVNYFETNGWDAVTPDRCAKWARETARPVKDATVAYRMRVARCFARHMAAVDPSCRVPRSDALRFPVSRRTPRVLTAREVEALAAHATWLRDDLPAVVYPVLIRLAWVTGARRGELLALDDSDIDLAGRVAHIKDAKFGKTRDVPLHPTTCQALERYKSRRDDLRPDRPTAALLVNTLGRRLGASSVERTFRALVAAAALGTAPGGGRIHFHDLRHSMIVGTITRWHQDRADTQALLPELSTFVGHRDPASTYWYVTGTAELLGRVKDRLEAFEAAGQGAAA
ncbi:MAG: tyrosine-type recombinase/integrase [Bifidobacteriaceae bacterium]|nr:tyrosine-type recombinase/integrase [Bifidobacteriaceae bacterium]